MAENKQDQRPREQVKTYYRKEKKKEIITPS